jgi:hypothetical protein
MSGPGVSMHSVVTPTTNSSFSVMADAAPSISCVLLVA